MLLQSDQNPDKTKADFTPLTGSVARKHLKQVSLVLNTPKKLTFYDFRRAGATWAFRRDVSIQDTYQGTWSSVSGGTYTFLLLFPLEFLLHFRHIYTYDVAPISNWCLGLASFSLHLYHSNTIYPLLITFILYLQLRIA